ncbi:MAG: chitobiase/beta-hexosaminidase C-terminal domain-containing protein [Muribaculaceae bacterium]|nr:chitobiase/beta-hexosaminidase C-terminal domain-containing protein [Muribaculaceae bacterium]
MRKLILSVLVALSAVLPATAATNIIGTIPSTSTVDRLYYFIRQHNSSFDREIAVQFLAVGQVYGVRGDIAICQSILETGWFKFDDGTAVTPDQHNYCGLGVTYTGATGCSFPTIKDGVTAQIQHLYAYACTSPLPAGETLIDPRFNYVNRGCAPTWESLGDKWSSASNYGTKILQLYDQMCAYNVPTTSSISTNPTSLSLSATTGGLATQSIAVTGSNLTSSITLTLSGTNASLFSLSTSSLTTAGGSVSVAYRPTAAGTHTATLTLKSGTATATVAITGTAKDPDVNPDWFTFDTVIYKRNDMISSADGRFSTGYGKYIYFNDKANSQVVRYDDKGYRTVYATVEGLGTGITSDDAGNLLVSTGFSTAASSTSWVIINAQNQSQTPVTFSGFTGARLDQVGRVVGDMTSSTGAYVYLTPNGASKIVAVKIANSQFVSAKESPATSLTFNTSTIAQPMYTSVSQVNALSNAGASAYYRQRSDRNIYSWSGSSSNSLGMADGATTGEGFDVFTLNGTKYSVEPASGSYPYGDGFVIRDLSKNQIVYTNSCTISPSSQRFQSINVRPNADGVSVTIYQSVSGEMMAQYTFKDNRATPVTEPPATPTFSPAGGTYTSAQTVSISCSTSGATIYYTTNGSTPTTSSTKYTSAITVSSTTTIKAIAVKDGQSSSVASATYTINTATAPAAPTFSPAAGTYATAQTVSISCATSGATIYYTANGSTPTTSSAKYTVPISVSSSMTLKAIAVKNGVSSAVSTAAYVIDPSIAETVESPTFSPAAGTYATAQTVSISCATSGATIYYTANGSTPTTSSAKYTVPISVSSSMTLKAIAVKNGVSSAVSTAAYVIDPSIAETVEKPTISPAGGVFSEGQTVVVTLACATSGATIYYTANGSTPTASSARYTVPMTITSNMTIKAVAIKNGKSSEVASAQFVFTNAVEGVDADDADVVNTDYFSLDGVRLTAPLAGQPCIKVATLADGSLRVAKVVIR